MHAALSLQASYAAPNVLQGHAAVRHPCSTPCACVITAGEDGPVAMAERVADMSDLAAAAFGTYVKRLKQENAKRRRAEEA